MKRFVFQILAVWSVMAAAFVYAGSGGGSITDPGGASITQVFTNQNITATSGVYTVNRNLYKSAIFASTSSNGIATTTLPGTMVVQCGPTITGPWVTAKTQADNAMSTTTPTIYTMQDFCQYLQFKWTQTSGAHSSVSAWLLYSD